MEKTNLNLDYLSPSGFIGIIILLIGILFTLMTFYVFYKVTTDDTPSINSKKALDLKEEQKEKIARLYPKGKVI